MRTLLVATALVASLRAAAEEPQRQVARDGLHFSLGAGAAVLPTGNGRPTTWVGLVAVMPALRYERGWWGLDLTAQLLGYFSTFAAGIVSLDLELRFHPGRHYTFGLGPSFGASFSPGPDLVVGVSASPAIISFGADGEHELFVWVGLPFLVSAPRVVVALLGYRYVF